jgi:DNA polymerase-3 subunit delta
VIIKSYIIEKNISNFEKYQASLIFGENIGIKEDIKELLKNKNKTAEIINLFEEEILKHKDILYNNVNNKSLFNEKKIIFIHHVTDKIVDQINEVLEKENKDIKIYIFGDALDKKSKIRSLFEKDSNLAAVACYKDNERTLIEYILEQLRAHKGLTRENIDIIISNSNLDRRVIKNELIKIKEFFKNKTITREELQQLLNIKINLNFDQLRDAALLGERSTINKLIGETEFLPEDIFFYLSSINYRVIKLIEVKNNNGDDNISIDAMKPKIFWKDKPIYIQQLKKWDIDKLKAASIKIAEVEKLMKKNAIIRNDLVIKDLLIHLCKQISTSSI